MNSQLIEPDRCGAPQPVRSPIDTVRWGFIGAGGIATNSVGPAVHAVTGSTVRVVASTDIARSRAIDPEIACSSYEQVLMDPEVDVVYISLHNSAHVRWCAEALAAGKHVLCEKPLAMTASEVVYLADLAKSRDRLLVEAMWARWHPRMRELRAILRHAAPTDVLRVETEFEGPEPGPGNYRHDPALGGGALLDLGCYAVAAVLEVFDWEIPTVLDAESQRGSGGADESTRAELRFAGGSASVRVALTGGHAERLRIDAGSVAVTLGAPVFTALSGESETEVRLKDGTARRIRYPASNPYRIMVESVAAAVRGEESWLVPLIDSHAVAVTLDAIRAAAGAPTEKDVEVAR